MDETGNSPAEEPTTPSVFTSADEGYKPSYATDTSGDIIDTNYAPGGELFDAKKASKKIPATPVSSDTEEVNALNALPEEEKQKLYEGEAPPKKEGIDVSPFLSNIKDKGNTPADFADVATSLATSPDFIAASPKDQIAALSNIYKAKPWNAETNDALKKVSASIWAGADPEERPDFRELFGSAPVVKKGQKPDEVLNAWKTQVTQKLIRDGYNINLLGDELDNYFNDQISNEKAAYTARNRSLLGTAVTYSKDAVGDLLRGALDFPTSIAAEVTRLGITPGTSNLPFEVREELAKQITKIPEDYTWKPSRDWQYVTDENGYLVKGPDGQPMEQWSTAPTRIIGQVTSIIATGGAASLAGVEAPAVTGSLFAGNSLSLANNIFEKVYGETNDSNKAYRASLYALPEAALMSLGELSAISKFTSPAILGLSPLNKARYLAASMASGAAKGFAGGTGGSYVEQFGIQQETGRPISTEEAIKTGVGVAIGSGIGEAAGSLYQTSVAKGAEVQAANNAPPANPPAATPPPPEVPKRIGLPAPIVYVDPAGVARTAAEFQKFQDSPETTTTINPGSFGNIDPHLADVMAVDVKANQDGTVTLTKRTTVPPLEINPNEDINAVRGRIDKLTTFLANAPHPSEAAELSQRKVDLQNEIAALQNRSKAEASTAAGLLPRKAELEADIARLKTLAPEYRGTEFEKIHAQELIQKTNELSKINNYLDENSFANKVADKQSELRDVSTKLSMLDDPHYQNNYFALDNQLKELMAHRQTLETEKIANDKVAAEKQVAEEQKLQQSEDTSPDKERLNELEDRIITIEYKRKRIAEEGKNDVTDQQKQLTKDRLNDHDEALLDAQQERDELKAKLDRAKKEPPIAKNEEGIPYHQVEPEPIGVPFKRGNAEGRIIPFEKGWYVTTKDGNVIGIKFKAFRDASKFVADMVPATEPPTEPGAKGVSNSVSADAATTNPEKVAAAAIDASNKGAATTADSRTRPRVGRFEPSGEFKKVSDKYTAPTEFKKDSEKPVSSRQMGQSAKDLLKSVWKYAPSKELPPIQEGGRPMPGKGKNVLGYIDYNRRYIWTRDPNDPVTAAHEVSHAVNDYLIPNWKTVSNETRNALQDMALTFYPDAKKLPYDSQLREGWAKFLEHYVTGQPIHKGILDFYNGDFKNMFPEIWNKMEAFKDVSYDHFNQTPEAYAKSFMGAEKAKRKLLPTWLEFKQNWLDNNAVIQKIDKLSGTEGAKEADVRRNRSREFVRYNIKNSVGNVKDANGNIVNDVRPLHDIISSVKDNIDRFNAYLLSKYTAGRAIRGQATGYPLEDAASLIKSIEAGEKEGDSKIVSAANEYYKWSENMLDIFGSQTPTTAFIANEIRKANLEATGTTHGFYLPFWREVAESLSKGEGSASANPMMRFRGNNRRIMTPLKVLEDHWSNLLNRANTNWKGYQLLQHVDNGSPVGAFVRELSRAQIPKYSSTIDKVVDAINSKLKGYGEEPVSLEHLSDPDVLNEAITFFAPETNPKASDGYQTIGVPTVVKDADGAPKLTTRYLQVSPEVFNWMGDKIPPFFMHPALYPLRKTARIASEMMTTYRPEFMERQVIRSAATAYTALPGLNPYPLVQSILKAIYSETLHAASGGKYTTPLLDFVDRLGVRHSIFPEGQIDSLIEEKTGRKVINLLGKNLDYIKNLMWAPVKGVQTGAVEQMAKHLGITDYSKPLTQEQYIALAHFGQSIPADYSRQGRYAKIANMFIPMFTANIAHDTQTIINWKNQPLKNSMVAATMLGLGITQGLLAAEETWRQSLGLEQKFTNWLSTFTDSEGVERILKIPLDRLSGLFNGMGVIIGEHISRNDLLRESTAEELQSFIGEVSPISSYGFMPLIFKEALEQKTNTDLRTGRSIVSQPEIPNPAQYTAYTSEFAKTLGQHLNISPQRVEHAIHTFFPAAIDAVHSVESATGIKADKENLKGLEAFSQAFIKPGTAAGVSERSAQVFYDKVKEYKQNKDIETVEEGEIRKKLNNIAKQISDVNAILGAEDDTKKRESLYEKKNKLLDLGVRLAAKQTKALVPDLGLKGQATVVRQKKKEILRGKLREAASLPEEGDEEV